MTNNQNSQLSFFSYRGCRGLKVFPRNIESPMKLVNFIAKPLRVAGLIWDFNEHGRVREKLRKLRVGLSPVAGFDALFLVEGFAAFDVFVGEGFHGIFLLPTVNSFGIESLGSPVAPIAWDFARFD
jgi:hypothetical protein